MSRVLIIDDEPALRSLLRQALTYSGYDVVEAKNGLEGLELCRSLRPDLVLTDLVMPEVSGCELIALLQREFSATPIIAISGSETHELDQAAQLGVRDVFPKPFDLWDLLEAVHAGCPLKSAAAAD